jgi:peptide/nickel transport system ATP-binding protein
VVEAATADVLFHESKMPYTLGLLGSLPRLDTTVREPLRPIPGSPPSLINLPDACPFAPRCPAVIPRCREEEPALNLVEPGHEAACIRATSLPNGGVDLFAPTWTDTESEGVKQETLTVGEMDGAAAPATVGATLVSVHDIVKHFPVRAGTFVRRTVAVAHAVDDVSFDVAERETLGLVGESGCGKSTTARVVLQLLPATSGSVKFEGTELVGKSRKEMRPFRRQLQMVFQDPFASLNPVHRIRHSLVRPLVIHHLAGDDVDRTVRELLGRVALEPPENFTEKFPHELSGGQRQRVSIARALAVRPRVLIADEPVSMLDVSIRLGVLNLLAGLRDQDHLAILYVTHDIASARYLADTIVVMYAGQLVESAPSISLTDHPAHPYTQLLLAAAPDPDRVHPPLAGGRGAPPSLVAPPSGCRFHPRCPHAMEVCKSQAPPSIAVAPGHIAACWLHVPPASAPVSQNGASKAGAAALTGPRATAGSGPKDTQKR